MHICSTGSLLLPISLLSSSGASYLFYEKSRRRAVSAWGRMIRTFLRNMNRLLTLPPARVPTCTRRFESLRWLLVLSREQDRPVWLSSVGFAELIVILFHDHGTVLDHGLHENELPCVRGCMPADVRSASLNCAPTLLDKVTVQFLYSKHSSTVSECNKKMVVRSRLPIYCTLL